MGGGVATEDEPPVVLGQLPATFVEQMARHLRPGKLLRFNIGDVSLHVGLCAGILLYK